MKSQLYAILSEHISMFFHTIYCTGLTSALKLSHNLLNNLNIGSSVDVRTVTTQERDCKQKIAEG